MNKLYSSFLFSIAIFLCTNPAAQSFQLMDVNFKAPAINGKTNADSPEKGAIILDTSTGTFYGNLGTPTAPNWTVLAGGSASNVSSPGAGQEHIVRARISTSGGTANITSQNAWLFSATNTAVGRTNLVLLSGIFSSDPTCTCTARYIIGGCDFEGNSPNMSNITIRTFRTDTNIDVDDEFDIICMGPS